uniref:14-3-3 domain-containing protein n=1 Tax=Quercus lobata TaxID=97700 RepID=A0A7N2MCD6_QUELO
MASTLPSSQSRPSATMVIDAMKKVAKLDLELTTEERNLLSIGHKNVLNARRASLRMLSSIEQKEEAKGNEYHVKHVKEYRKKVESEISAICNDIMTVIDEHLLKLNQWNFTTRWPATLQIKLLIKLFQSLTTSVVSLTKKAPYFWGFLGTTTTCGLRSELPEDNIKMWTSNMPDF